MNIINASKRLSPGRNCRFISDQGTGENVKWMLMCYQHLFHIMHYYSESIWYSNEQEMHGWWLIIYKIRGFEDWSATLFICQNHFLEGGKLCLDLNTQKNAWYICVRICTWDKNIIWNELLNLTVEKYSN